MRPMTTTHVRAQDTEERWYLYDATQFPLGRLASAIAVKLMGKDQPTYTPSERCGAHVVVINGAKAQLTGKKNDTKEYQRYSGYPGGLNITSLERVREQRPEEIVTLAVRRMLPKNRLGHDMLRLLKVYPGEEHPHGAQNPTPVDTL